ncbi:MAG TPA: glycosyl hydrolase [Pyrinomonadaceae bacterium]|nr:glycosyl hydrolase [Pyrinomonadaceae bacterium]
MKRIALTLLVLLSLVALMQRARAQSVNITDLQRGFEHPPDDAKIMMRWWWFGPAVTRPELEREMRLMKEGGIGGFEVQPVYPLLPDDPTIGIKNLPFLSDEFLDALRFTSAKARELGLRMDLTLGSGWPFGGAQVPISDAAGMLRTERVKVEGTTRRVPVPSITAGEKLLAVFLARAEGKSIAETGLRELTEIKDGAVWLPMELGGANEVLFFISSRTGMQVKRPAVGAEGYVLNHLDRTAADNYLKNVGDRLMQAFGANRPYAIFCDSLEVYGQDWTSDLLEEFRRRRGYDLKPYLPALVADMGPKTEEVRYDWGRTLTELLNERFLAPLHEWAKKNGTLFRIQDYGVPAAALSSNAYADLPEGEGPQWKTLRASRWASSASHLYGRQVTSSETWTWLHSPVFRATPLDMKAEADLHFLVGINQLIGHGWPYTPPQVEYPGWRFYAAAVFDEKNPWWIVMPDIALYLQRMSYLLRQGRPANDVALYLPNSDAWAHFSGGNTHMIEVLRERVGPELIPRLLEAGYDFDFFDDDVLLKLGRVERGTLVLGASRYRVVVLPGVERIPPDSLRKLEEFVRGGGVLVATRRLPQLAPGLRATEAEKSQVRETVSRLFEGASPPAHFVKDEAQLAAALNNLLRPDVALSPAVPEIGFIHRQTSDAEIYFVANTSNTRQVTKATFRVEGPEAQWWDPLTGRVRSAMVQGRAEGGTTIALDLEPYGSRVVVFTKRTLATEPALGNGVAAAPPIDLSTDWRVTFGQDSRPVMMDKLRSWTDEESTRYFSGTAVYEKEVTVPEGTLKDGLTVRLDFGEGTPLAAQQLKAGMQTWLDAPVREAAVVYINDRRAGSVWCPPYSLDVTKFLRSGPNKIRIIVANLALNYMAGRRLPDYKLLNLRYGERFQAQDMDKVQPAPAGLLGPVRLLITSQP